MLPVTFSTVELCVHIECHYHSVVFTDLLFAKCVVEQPPCGYPEERKSHAKLEGL